MDLQAWIAYVTKACVEAGVALPDLPERLSEKVPPEEDEVHDMDDVIMDDVIMDDVMEALGKPKGQPTPAQLEVANNIMEPLAASFFQHAIHGRPYGSMDNVHAKRGSLDDTVFVSGCQEYRNLAYAYLTFDAELHELAKSHRDVLVYHSLKSLEGMLAGVFFPHVGPLHLPVNQRIDDMRKLLTEYAPELNTEAFYSDNPVLRRERALEEKGGASYQPRVGMVIVAVIVVVIVVVIVRIMAGVVDRHDHAILIHTEIIRTVIAVIIAWMAFRHSVMWGRMFMNLYGMKSPLEVSQAYLNPLTRTILFPGVQVGLLVLTWLIFPFGHWGLLVVLFSLYGYKAGMRCEMLRAFVNQVLLELEQGTQFTEAWKRAEQTIMAVTGLTMLNVQQHTRDPAALMKYVSSRTRSPSEASEIRLRWSKWLESQPKEAYLSVTEREEFSRDIAAMTEVCEGTESIQTLAAGHLRMAGGRKERAILFLTNDRFFFSVRIRRLGPTAVPLDHVDVAKVVVGKTLIRRRPFVAITSRAGTRCRFFTGHNADVAVEVCRRALQFVSPKV